MTSPIPAAPNHSGCSIYAYMGACFLDDPVSIMIIFRLLVTESFLYKFVLLPLWTLCCLASVVVDHSSFSNTSNIRQRH